MTRRAVAIALVALAACVDHVQLSAGGGSGAIPDLRAIAVSPPSTTLDVELGGAPHLVPFAATGTFADGSTRDITSEVAWSADSAAAGAFGSASGVYASTNEAGARVAVTASAGPLAGSAALTIVLSASLVDPSYPPPAGAGELFGSGAGTTDPMKSPALRYPSDGVMFPQRLAPVLVQYAPGAGNDVVRLAFDSDVLHASIVTAAPDRFLPDGPLWNAIAASGVAGPIALAISAVSSTAAPPVVYAGSAATLAFAPDDAAGAIDYWSNATNGIFQAPLASSAAAPLYPPSGDATCAGCHTATRDGAHLAFGYGGDTLQSIDTTTLATTISASQKIPMSFATYSPDGTRLVVATTGTLVLRDAATGAPIGANGGVVPLPGPATHPDWSPDGTRVVVALANGMPSDMDMKGGRIAVVPFANDAWGAATTIVSSTADNDNNFFPKWSPDGRLIAYVHASSSSHAAPTAELRLVAAAGGAPIALATASHRVGFAAGVPNLADTMPAWGPQHGAIAWLAFASTRPYGAVRPMMTGPSQIWIAAVDLSRAGDPSYAAFWLAAQTVTATDNNPVWIATAVPVD